MFVSGFSFINVRYDRSALTFYSIFCMSCMYLWTFLSFLQTFDSILLRFNNKMFSVGAKTWVGSGNLKHTYIFFALSVELRSIWSIKNIKIWLLNFT